MAACLRGRTKPSLLFLKRGLILKTTGYSGMLSPVIVVSPNTISIGERNGRRVCEKRVTNGGARGRAIPECVNAWIEGSYRGCRRDLIRTADGVSLNVQAQRRHGA